MFGWIFYSLIAAFLWGIVGVLQKLGANRISEASLLVWLMAGLALILPWLLMTAELNTADTSGVIIGLLGGVTNGLGVWSLLAAFKNGAKASLAVPLTALNPLFTILLAILILGEKLTTLQWLGVTMALLSGVLIASETKST